MKVFVPVLYVYFRSLASKCWLWLLKCSFGVEEQWICINDPRRKEPLLSEAKLQELCWKHEANEIL